VLYPGEFARDLDGVSHHKQSLAFYSSNSRPCASGIVRLFYHGDVWSHVLYRSTFGKLGVALCETDQDFNVIMNSTKPWLWMRSLSGALMMVGHFVFAASFVMILMRLGKNKTTPTLFEEPTRGGNVL